MRKDLKEFIATQANPGKINLGHAGVGSSNFLICKSFAQAAESRCSWSAIAVPRRR